MSTKKTITPAKTWLPAAAPVHVTPASSSGTKAETKLTELTKQPSPPEILETPPDVPSDYQALLDEVLELRTLCANQEDQINKQTRTVLEQSQKLDTLEAEKRSIVQTAFLIVSDYEHQVETRRTYSRLHFTSCSEGSRDVQNNAGSDTDDEDEPSDGVMKAIREISLLNEDYSNSEGTPEKKRVSKKKASKKETAKASTEIIATGEQNLRLAQLEFSKDSIPEEYESYITMLEKFEELITDKKDDGSAEELKKPGPVTKGHFERWYSDALISERVYYHDISGEQVDSIEQIPKVMELNGRKLTFLGFDTVEDRVVLIPATLLKSVHKMAKYKATLEGDSRSEAIIAFSEGLDGLNLTIDGYKKAVSQMENADTDKQGIETASNGSISRGVEMEEAAWTGVCRTADVIEEASTGGKGTAAMDGCPAEVDNDNPPKDSEEKSDRKHYPKGIPVWKQREYQTVVHARSPLLAPLFSGSPWSPSMVAMILFLHLGLFLPITRIRVASMAFLGGANIPLSTMEALIQKVYDKKFKILVDLIKDELLIQSHIHADETPLRVLRGERLKSYIWLYSSVIDVAQHQVRYFECNPGRGAEFALLMLCGFTGVLITDAYQGYNKVQCIHAFCLLHARRRFYEASVIGQGKNVRNKAKVGLGLFNDLFRMEKQLRKQGYTGDQLLEQRKKQMTPIVSQIRDYCNDILNDPHVSQSGKLHNAASYYINNETELTQFLNDSKIPLHNMAAEWMAKTVTYYRRSSLHCGSMAGARAMAGILTIIETAKANNLDTYKYLLFLLENMRGDEWMKDAELVKSLLPWSEKAQEACRKSSSKERHDGQIELAGGLVA